MNQLKTKNIVQAIIEDILDQIKNGILKPGDRLLSQRELKDNYNVGRSSIREALQALAYIKIIDIRPGKGAVVLQPTFNSLTNPIGKLINGQGKEILDLQESREILEIGAIKITAKKCSEKDLRNLEENVDLMEKTLKEKNFVNFLNLDYNFHKIIFECTYNNVLINIFSTIYKTLSKNLSISLQVPDSAHKAVKSHKEIIGYLREHDVERAISSMKSHLTNAKKDLKKVIKK